MENLACLNHNKGGGWNEPFGQLIQPGYFYSPMESTIMFFVFTLVWMGRSVVAIAITGMQRA